MQWLVTWQLQRGVPARIFAGVIGVPTLLRKFFSAHLEPVHEAASLKTAIDGFDLLSPRALSVGEMHAGIMTGSIVSRVVFGRVCGYRLVRGLASTFTESSELFLESTIPFSSSQHQPLVFQVPHLHR